MLVDRRPGSTFCGRSEAGTADTGTGRCESRLARTNVGFHTLRQDLRCGLGYITFSHHFPSFDDQGVGFGNVDGADEVRSALGAVLGVAGNGALEDGLP